ncbi:Cell differentiation protein rcd1 [Phlyctochytrium bullatum]|nr:Cell differentiation protein rcd1 [Phlyctochytrium bullatum]
MGLGSINGPGNLSSKSAYNIGQGPQNTSSQPQNGPMGATTASGVSASVPASQSTGSMQNPQVGAQIQSGQVGTGNNTAPGTGSAAPSVPANGTSAQGAGVGSVQNALNSAIPGVNIPVPPMGQLVDEEKIYSLILDLTSPQTREQALLELSKKREAYEDLAPILWHSFGVMAALLQEIVSVYPALAPPTLTGHASNRVCNALALLQCVASHNETRGLFLNAHIPLFLYPFLNTTSKTRPFEYLRLTSLGVIGALVKNDNPEVINFLLSTEIIPLCLRIMENGSELSKTVAIFIVQKILLDEMGLNYICQTYERFYAVGTVLANMVTQLVEQQSVRLLKHVIRCYLRLSDNPRAREALRQCLPEPLRDSTFSMILKDDITTKRCLAALSPMARKP